MKHSILSLFVILLLSCSQLNFEKSNKEVNFSNDLINLSNWMSGSFSSSNQSLQDSSFFDINLEMVRIWNDRTDAIWLYVEQASSKRLNSPYRQRVYRLTQEEDQFFSKVYELKNKNDFIGAHNNTNLFNSIDINDLIERQGCTVTMYQNDTHFTGTTKDKECKSLLFGASYATSEVEIFQDKILSWDRGYDSDGIQVWGSVDGPYIFQLVNKYN